MQVNSPYPATAYLKSHLKSLGHFVQQRDYSLELFLKVFSREGLAKVADELQIKKSSHESVRFFLEAPQDYLDTIDSVIRFLQGKDASLAIRIAKRKFLPEGPRFLILENEKLLPWAFGDLGYADQAKYLASLYLDDLADVLKHGLDPHFEFSRYGEKLAASKASFSELYERLQAGPNLIDQFLREICAETSKEHFDVLGLTVPFPGNVYGALRVAQFFKEVNPKIKVVLGGGFANTELRSLSDSRFFQFIDYVTLDDGERPLEKILDLIEGKLSDKKLLRTYFKKDKTVTFSSDAALTDKPFKNIEAPDFSDLDFSKYVSMYEMLNPVHRLWSDFKWNKFILAHGCYWSQCTFCDTSLDYIARYEPQKPEIILKQMVQVSEQTGQSGFHFVDEAAPPALLKGLSKAIVEGGQRFSWWGNIRFEKSFSRELTDLMADAGCIAVTGGLEVASERILRLINKGVDLKRVAQVTKNFTQSGILVHAYLMYGFPSQTEQETVDSLEVVRQLFEAGCLKSAYWHRFSATVHSPVGLDPKKFGIKLHPPKTPPEGLFGMNDVAFTDSVKVDHDGLGQGLRKGLYNFMHDLGIKEDVRAWFDIEVPKTSLPKNLIKNFLS